jgi:hypothetical protein
MASWLFLAVLVIIWAVCVFPKGRGRSPAESVQEFERGLDLLADTRRADGRWIVAPRKGAQFLGVRHRARLRARARRRRVFVFLLEVMFLTFLMGLFPPLRPFWYATSAFFGMLTLYVVALLTISRNERELQRMQERFVHAVDAPGQSATRAALKQEARHGIYERHVAIGRGRATRPAYNGLSVIDTEEVHVVVRSARELQPAAR